jgi:hypothetical protein
LLGAHREKKETERQRQSNSASAINPALTTDPKIDGIRADSPRAEFCLRNTLRL